MSRRRSIVLVAIVLLAAACAGSTPPSAPAASVEAIDAAEFGLALCEAVDQVEVALGDRRTGEASNAWLAVETALDGRDPDAIDAATSAVLGHLSNAASWARRATGFLDGAHAARAWEAFATDAREAVRTIREGGMNGDAVLVDRGRRALEVAMTDAYRPAADALAALEAAGHELPCGS